MAQAVKLLIFLHFLKINVTCLGTTSTTSTTSSADSVFHF
jgi:hypothetical protein